MKEESKHLTAEVEEYGMLLTQCTKKGDEIVDRFAERELSLLRRENRKTMLLSVAVLALFIIAYMIYSTLTENH